MLELTAENAAEILQSRGWLPSTAGVRVQELSGGVSNAVFLIETPTDRFVVKQARGKLRVQADWQCSVERIWREVEVLRAITELLDDWRLTSSPVPRFRWRDSELYSFAMTAASADSQTWKAKLFACDIDTRDPWYAGSLLGRIHARSWHQPNIAEQFDDRTYFAQLRLEPYYLWAAQEYPVLRTKLRELADQTWLERHCLVHGDFSPKNLLVWHHEQMLIDFEVGHYGDPAFDLGFCLTHLVLKAIHFADQGFLTLADSLVAHWHVQLMRVAAPPDLHALEFRASQHLAGCLVARVHGKSPVDYLTPPEQLQAVALAEKLFGLGLAASWNEASQLLQEELAS